MKDLEISYRTISPLHKLVRGSITVQYHSDKVTITNRKPTNKCESITIPREAYERMLRNSKNE